MLCPGLVYLSSAVTLYCDVIGRAMRKRVFWHMRTAKALINLRTCAVCPQAEALDIIECFKGGQQHR